MKIAFLLYPTAKVKPSEDTSFWIAHELIARGHTVCHFESRDLFWSEGAPRAFVRPSRTHVRRGFLLSALSPRPADLSAFDAVIIRKEPPFDTAYLYALQLLATLKGRVFVSNDPEGIALCNEKLFILGFPRHIPDTLVTEDPLQARRFVKALGTRAVLKRLDDKGGSGIVATSPADRNLPSLLEIATASGSRRVMVQRFVDADRYGDKRILLLEGEPIGCFVRRPPRHDFRANIGVGGSFHRAVLTASDRRLVADLEPALALKGLHLAGIDVIGRYLTEVNVTSPSGIADVIVLYREHPEKRVADFIERRAREVAAARGRGFRSSPARKRFAG